MLAADLPKIMITLISEDQEEWGAKTRRDFGFAITRWLWSMHMTVGRVAARCFGTNRLDGQRFNDECGNGLA